MELVDRLATASPCLFLATPLDLLTDSSAPQRACSIPVTITTENCMPASPNAAAVQLLGNTVKVVMKSYTAICIRLV